MTEPWATLVPLAAGSALVPIQVVVTVLLLRAPGGPRAAAAFVGGMTALRLTQGIVFGFVFSGSDASDGATGPGTIASALLVALGILLYVTAGRALLGEDDPDAPPPKWIAMTETMTSPRAFLFGAAIVAIGPKFWVFTLSAISAIETADLSRGASTLTYIGFVLAAQSLLLVAVLVGAAMPRRSATALEALSGWLTRNDTALLVIIGAIFGTWFLMQGLNGLGVI